jgi:hypothetical protein
MQTIKEDLSDYKTNSVTNLSKTKISSANEKRASNKGSIDYQGEVAIDNNLGITNANKHFNYGLTGNSSQHTRNVLYKR